MLWDYGEAITKRLRIQLLTSVLRQEIGYHDDPAHTPGKLTHALQVYANRMSVLFISIGDNANALASVIVGVTIAFVSCWQMALALLAAMPIMAACQAFEMRVQMGSAKQESKVLDTAQQVVSDSIIGVRTVQACGNEHELVKLYSNMVNSAQHGSGRRSLVSGLLSGFSNSVQIYVMAFGFWFLGELMSQGNADFEGGMKAIMGLLYAAMGAGMASSMTGDVGKAKVAAHSMFQLLDRKSLIDGLEPVGKKPEQADDFEAGRIEFQNVHFFYPFRSDVKVLTDLCFLIEPGQSVGLVGPSGSGKSTVMSLLQRFYDPRQGKVLVGRSKVQLSELSITWWRRQIGFVGQEPVLFEGSVLDNIRYGLADDEELSAERLGDIKRMANLNFLDASKAQGWETQVGLRGSRLSGGQKQRVAIARALARNPPLLLLDEATSALDGQSEHVVQAALEVARQGRTSFSIAHRLPTIQDCDVIIVMAEGKVYEKGSHAELMELEGLYYKLQMQGKRQSRTSTHAT